MEFEADAVPSYLQPEPEVEPELNLPAAPSGGQYPPGKTNPQVRSLVSFYVVKYKTDHVSIALMRNQKTLKGQNSAK